MDRWVNKMNGLWMGEEAGRTTNFGPLSQLGRSH